MPRAGIGTAPLNRARQWRAQALRARLCLLSLHVAEPNADEIQLELDGQRLTRQHWSAPVPVERGAHHLSAHAPGRATFEHDFQVPPFRDRIDITIPVFAAAIDRAPKAASDAAALDANPQRLWGYVAGGVGLASLALGAVLGVVRNDKVARIDAFCPDRLACDPVHRPAVNKLRNEAQTFATGANLGLLLGAGLIVTGVTLVLTAPNTRPRSDIAVRASRTAVALYLDVHSF